MIFNESVAVPPTAQEVDLGYSYPDIPSFNGTSDWIEIPYSGDFNPHQFTVELWVDYQGGIGYRAILTSVCSSATEGRRGYLFCVNPAGNWQFWVGSGQPDGPWVMLTGPRAAKGVWTHLAGIYNEQSQTVFFYINGSLVAQRTGSPFHPNERNSLRVGAGATEQSGASPCFFQGRIAQIRIWNHPLSLADISTLANPDLIGEKEIPNSHIWGEQPLNNNNNVEAILESPVPPESEIPNEPINHNRPLATKGLIPPTPLKKGGFKEFGKRSNVEAIRESPVLPESEIPNEPINNNVEAIRESPVIDPKPDVLEQENPLINNVEAIRESPVLPDSEIAHEPINNNVEAIRESPVIDTEPDVLGIDVTDAVTSETEEPTELPVISPTLEEPETESVPAAKSFQSALMFNGINSSVKIKTPFKNNRTFTLSLWVKPALLDQGWCGLFSNDSGEHLPPLQLGIAPNGGLYYDSFDAAGTCRYHNTLDGFFETTDRWVQIAWVKVGTEYRFYRNGELYAIHPAPDRFYLHQSQALIGMGEHGFAGAIRDVRVWKVPRTATEIRHDLHRPLTGEEPGLSHYWAFNEGNGAIASDGAKCANWGNIIGATWGQGNPKETSPQTPPLRGEGLSSSPSPLREGGWGVRSPINSRNYTISDSSPNEESRPVLCFAGGTNYIEVEDPFENDTTFTISLWLRPANVGPNPYGIMGKRWWPSAFKPELWGVDYQQTLYYHTVEPSSPNRRHAAPLLNFFAGSEGDWVHLTWVKAGTEYRFYRNGKLFATQSAPERFYTDNTTYWFGKLGIGNSVAHFRGQMSDIQVWNVALSEEQIQENLQQGVTGEEPGLRYYWPLNEGEGTRVQDRANRPNHGTIRGATWQSEEVAIAMPEPEFPLPHVLSSVLTFDGEDDTVILPELGEMDRTFTLSLWVKPATLDDERWHGILSKGGKSEDQLGLSLCPGDRALQYHARGLGVTTLDSNVLLNFFASKEQWVHVTWVKAGTLYHFYRNGEWFATQPAPERLQQTPGEYYFGKSQVFGNRDSFFAGQIAEVRLWRVARTEAESQNDFTQRLQGDEPGLIAYYPLNEGEGDWVGDRGRILGARWELMEIPLG